MAATSRPRAHAPAQAEELARRRLDALLAELAGDPGHPPPGPEQPDPQLSSRDDTGQLPPVVGRHAFRPLPRGTVWGGWIEDRLPDTWRGRVRLGPAQVGAVAVLLSVGVLITAWSMTRSADEVLPASAAPVVTPATDEGAVAPTGSPASVAAQEGETAAGASSAVPAGGVDLVVDVQGAVRRPGIVVLPSGSRVVDALDAAGGYRGKPRLLKLLNLARPLVDGEQVLAGRPSGTTSVSPPAASSTTTGQPLVSLNTADQAALETLPGVGPVTAAAILQWRSDHGAFTAVDQLIEVSGIGEKTLAQIAPFVTL